MTNHAHGACKIESEDLSFLHIALSIGKRWIIWEDHEEGIFDRKRGEQ